MISTNPSRPNPCDGRPVCRVEREQARSRREQDARADAPLARPVGDAARGGRDGWRHLVAPDLVSAVGVEREHLVAARRQIHHAGDDDRRHLRIASSGITFAVGSRSASSRSGASSQRHPLREPRRPLAVRPARSAARTRPASSRDTLPVLMSVKRREPAAGRVAAVHRPVAVVRRRSRPLPRDHDGDDERGERRNQQRLQASTRHVCSLTGKVLGAESSLRRDACQLPQLGISGLYGLEE